MVVLTQTLSAVTSSGSIATIAVPSSLKGLPIDRILIHQTAGDAASYAAELSTDATVADRLKRIAAFAGATTASPIDTNSTYHFDPSAAIYVKVTPNTGSNNAYTIKVYVNHLG